MSLADAPLPALIEACLQESTSVAWEYFICRVQPVFARAAYRVAAEHGGVATQDIDDIVQEICLKLGSRGREILWPLCAEPEQRVFAYLKVMAINAARDYFKAKFAEKRGKNAVVSYDSVPEEFACGETGQAVEKKILASQVDAALDANPRERTIFWLYYEQGFTAKEIAAIPHFGLTAKGVESLIYRLGVGAKGSLNRPATGGGSEKG